MNKLSDSSISEIIAMLNKIEAITKVLSQTLADDFDFNINDSQNLCTVLLREISYIKAKLIKLIEI